MREKIVPVCGHMTAQRAQELAWTMDGLERAPLFYTQARPRIDGTTSPSSCPTLRHGEKPHPEFMFGGHIEMDTQSFFEAVGCTDDSQVEFRVSPYLVPWWGGELVDDDDHFQGGRMKKAWFGIFGFSVDGLCWVGSAPSKVSGRSGGRE
ncbi:uncharacterized protein ARMOST_15550 [Armillaria ostoyae]|uniref:Uncharacterized protein n=1 Tax=Armillaria ostoyae TaxID=47428 RepID=A0A284RTM7_ARMOS|nr:uncharacterized protein ARMOST_15550 [Armillaria ostoyae]